MLQAVCLGLVALTTGARLLGVSLGLNLSGEGLGIGWPIPTGATGQMSASTALCFLAFCVGGLASRYGDSRPGQLAMRGSAAVLLLAGMIVGVGHWLKLAYLFEALYFSTGIVWMSFPTACGMVLLGCGLWGLSREHTESATADPKAYSALTRARQIYQTTNVVVAGILMASGLMGLGFLAAAIESQVRVTMAQVLAARIAFIDVNLDYRAQRALVASGDSSLRAAAAGLIDPRVQLGTTSLASAISQAKHVSSQLLTNGFSAVAIEVDGLRTAVAGTLLPEDAFRVRLRDKGEVWLAWHKQFYLRVRVPIPGEGGKASAGHLIVEQTLPRLDAFFTEANQWGETGSATLCARGDTSDLACFPQREQSAPFKLAGYPNGVPLPATNALLGQRGIDMTIDYRGRNVLAAYQPVGNTGLGLVLRMDLAEVFAPVKRQLVFGLPLFAMLALLALWLIRLRVRPLLVELSRAYADEEAQRTRFSAAMESSPDGFVIYENVTNEANEIVDLRFAFVNQHAKNASELSGMVEGRTYQELLPDDRDTFAKFKNVFLSGHMLVEEFSAPDGAGGKRWYRRQAVAMPKGLAVTVSNITSERSLLQQVEDSNLLRTAIVESAAYAIISTDVEGTILTFNKAEERMLWFSAQELVGKGTPALFHDTDEVITRAAELTSELGYEVAPGFDVFVAKPKKDLLEAREWTYVRKDGSRLPVLLSITALRDGQNLLHGFLGIAHDISEQKRADEYFRHFALHDLLTGLPNRALLVDRVHVAIERQRRFNTSFALVMMDIDRFKQVNDTMGHHIGDKLLKIFAERVHSCLRPTDTLARMGGDEFVLLLNECDEHGALIVADRILRALLPLVDVGPQAIPMTSCMGISICPRDGIVMDELLRCADIAMYWVKAHGRNGYKLFSSSMDVSTTPGDIKQSKEGAL